MSSTLRTWLAAVTVAVSGLAGAADVTPGFGASVRLGYGAPLGKLWGGSTADLGDVFSGQVPVQVDLGYRVTPQLTLAMFGQYGVTFVGAGAGCGSNGVRCSGSTVRGGVEALWHFLPGHALDPWLGFGAGYEWSTLRFQGAGAAGEVQLRGLEYGNVQLGADHALTPTLSVGPYAQLTFAEYSSVGGAVDGSSTGPLAGTRTHDWLQLGIRGTFNL